MDKELFNLLIERIKAGKTLEGSIAAIERIVRSGDKKAIATVEKVIASKDERTKYVLTAVLVREKLLYTSKIISEKAEKTVDAGVEISKDVAAYATAFAEEAKNSFAAFFAKVDETAKKKSK